MTASETPKGTSRSRGPRARAPLVAAPTARTHSSSWRRSAAGSSRRVTPRPVRPKSSPAAPMTRSVTGTLSRLTRGGARCPAGAAPASRRARGRGDQDRREAAPSGRRARWRAVQTASRWGAPAQHPVEEHRVAEQVAAPHPPRLEGEPEDPFEAVVGHPVRCARRAPGDVVEQRADGPHHRRPRSGWVAVDPQLLLGGAHAHEHDVRACASMCSRTRSEWGASSSK